MGYVRFRRQLSTASIMAPDTKRMVVKLDASIVVSLSAALHSSEFAENANMARRVIEIILVLGINRWAPVFLMVFFLVYRIRQCAC